MADFGLCMSIWSHLGPLGVWHGTANDSQQADATQPPPEAGERHSGYLHTRLVLDDGVAFQSRLSPDNFLRTHRGQVSHATSLAPSVSFSKREMLLPNLATCNLLGSPVGSRARITHGHRLGLRLAQNPRPLPPQSACQGAERSHPP